MFTTWSKRVVAGTTGRFVSPTEGTHRGNYRLIREPAATELRRPATAVYRRMTAPVRAASEPRRQEPGKCRAVGDDSDPVDSAERLLGRLVSKDSSRDQRTRPSTR